MITLSATLKTVVSAEAYVPSCPSEEEKTSPIRLPDPIKPRNSSAVLASMLIALPKKL